jgi:hypothetical protein
MKNMTNFIINICSGLAFKYIWLNSLKSIGQAPVRLIDKRGLICDHNQLLTLFTFEKYLFTLQISTAIDFRKFNF